jgi:hypothetical protein
MSDKQNLSHGEDESSPAGDQKSRDQSGSSPKSYYYDDSTGYEIYQEETETDEEAEAPDEEDR